MFRLFRYAFRQLLTLTLVLIACAGWMIGGVYLLLHQPLGFAPDRLLMMRALLGSDHSTKEDAIQLELKFSQMAASLRQLPGVEYAAVTDHVPLGHAINRYDFCSDVHPEQCNSRSTSIPTHMPLVRAIFRPLGKPY
jgi:hypothetical protein